MLPNLHSGARSEEGFTLIELLVVILIIGILAAIALPSFLGQRSKAQDAAAKSDARNALSQMESCFTDNETYINCTSSGPGNPAVISAQTIDGYAVTATSKTGNRFFIYHNPTGTNTRICSVLGGKTGAGCATVGAATQGTW
ncbi:MAG: type pilus assembly protein PilA [Solirubrobacteraceae bacterium]|jgi:type IV pilus assembly protein PilA|nr:type pilus assembly protein PilA [Solirubrobacteraceae bacterium]MEA2187776.1 type pilus assembly protein PilA [Solirubrobacteraceae bacterium]